MRSLLLLLFIWLAAPPAKADFLHVAPYVGLTEHLLNRETGELLLYPGVSEQMVPDVVIDQYAPGSQMRTDYAASVARLRNDGVATGFFNDCSSGIICEMKTEFTKLVLPQGADFFDHHFEGLQELRQRLDAAPPIPTVAFHQDIVSLLAFYDTHEQIARIMLVLSLPAMEKQDSNLVPTLHALFENRHFVDHVLPQPKLVLARDAFWNIDLGLFALPFDKPNRAEHHAARRVTYDVTSTGQTEPSRIRLQLKSDLMLTVVDGTIACDANMLCEATWNGPTRLVIEFGEPVVPEGQFEFETEITADLSRLADVGDWESVAQDIWPIDFSRCNSRYVKAIRALQGSDADALLAARASRKDLSPISALPGRLLYGEFPMENADEDAPAPPPAMSRYSTGEVKAALQSLAHRKLLDDYLAKDVWGANGEKHFVDAMEELPYVLECDADRLEVLYGRLDDILPQLREGREVNTRMAEQAQSTAIWWSDYVKVGLAEIEDEEVFENSKDPTDEQILDLATASELGVVIDIFLELKYGAEAMATTSSRMNAAGAVLVTLQALSSAHDAYKLYQLFGYNDEAISWLEATAYFAPMAERYQKLEDRVNEVLSKHRIAEAESCRCFNP